MANESSKVAFGLSLPPPAGHVLERSCSEQCRIDPLKMEESAEDKALLGLLQLRRSLLNLPRHEQPPILSPVSPRALTLELVGHPLAG